MHKLNEKLLLSAKIIYAEATSRERFQYFIVSFLLPILELSPIIILAILAKQYGASAQYDIGYPNTTNLASKFLIIILLLSVLLRIVLIRLQIMMVTNFISRFSTSIIIRATTNSHGLTTLEENNELRAILTTKMERLAFHGLIQGSSLISAASFLFLLILYSIIQFGFISISYAIFVGLLYVIFFVSTNQRRKILSKDHNQSLNLLSLALNVLTNQFRDVRAVKMEKVFTDQFTDYNSTFRNTYGRLEFLGKIPKVVIESSIVIFVLYVVQSSRARDFSSHDLIALLPIVYLVLKLVQAFQVIYVAVNSISGNADVISSITAAASRYKQRAPFKFLPTSVPELICVTSSSGKIYEFEYGNKYALTGPSGSGKTTIIEHAIGVRKLEGWTVEFDGKQIDSEFELMSVCYIYQGQNLLPMSLLENIIGNSKKVDETRLRTILAYLQIEHLVDRNIHPLDLRSKISGGEAQRVLIARAMYGSYDVVVFDEATSALDKELDRAVHEWFSETPNQLFVSVTHRPELLPPLISQMKIM